MVPTSNTFSWDKGLQGVEEKEKKYLTNLLVRWWQIFQMVAVLPCWWEEGETKPVNCLVFWSPCSPQLSFISIIVFQTVNPLQHLC